MREGGALGGNFASVGRKSAEKPLFGRRGPLAFWMLKGKETEDAVKGGVCGANGKDRKEVTGQMQINKGRKREALKFRG